MKHLQKKYKTDKITAIELFATNPLLSYKDIGKKVGVTERTIAAWMSHPDFVDECYKRYMEVAGIELPSVVASMVEEAKRGNVQAGRLVLEHFGKLENKVKIQVESPFEKFMRIDAEDADFIDMSDKETDAIDRVATAMEISNIDLPKRDIRNDNPKEREISEATSVKSRMNKAMKSEKTKKKLHDAYVNRKRAKAVGLDLLGSGRHTKGERDKWMETLESLEIKKFGEVQV